jgi:hypothetical protein
VTKQNKPLFTENNIRVTRDLTHKIEQDVIDLIGRTLEIAPPTKLPIIIGAATSAIGYLAFYMEHGAGIENPKNPDRKSILLSALLVAYTLIHQEPSKVYQAAIDATDLLIKEDMI